MVYWYEEVQQLLRDNETFASPVIIQAFGDVLDLTETQVTDPTRSVM